MKFPDAAEEPLKGLENGKCRKQKGSLRGPKRAIRLCVLGILMPALFISVPLYLRYRVYDPQLYPMAVTDMRTIDGKISTTWCQGNIIHSNISFNAFLMRNKPKIAASLKQVQMTRHLILDDDMKEYWGFYLLKGSKVIVSSCSSEPGASLVIIKGHRHLQECAYIGDDSSEEEDELEEIAAEKEALLKGHTMAPTNRVEMLKKHRPEVSFENKKEQKMPSKFSNVQNQAHEDETDMKTVKEMRLILDRINEKKAHIRSKPAKSEAKEKVDDSNVPHPHHPTDDNTHRHRNLELGKAREGNVKFDSKEDEHETSDEVFRSIMKKIGKLGARGKKLLEILQKEVDLDKEIKSGTGNTATTTATTTTKNSQIEAESNPVSEDTLMKVLRKRRDLILKTAMSVELNADDEPENSGGEEGFVPDEHADHHKVVNETTANDRSNSEIWSSFSSSEEALLECPGLIMSLPLTSSRTCKREKNDTQLREEFSPNTITFTVTTNGYYFFIFSSENEIEQNYVRAMFNLKKVVYDVSDPVQQCTNQSQKCILPLDFLSNEQVVIELPADEGRIGSSEEFILVSECQPRTSIYLICILAVPFMILAFAFQ